VPALPSGPSHRASISSCCSTAEPGVGSRQ
jgi:hypothetical protein